MCRCVSVVTFAGKTGQCNCCSHRSQMQSAPRDLPCILIMTSGPYVTLEERRLWRQAGPKPVGCALQPPFTGAKQ